jgi:hypothetical protein
VVPAGATASASTQTSQPAPVYEYWWTIGHPGHRPEHGGLLEHITGPNDLWERLPDPAARVYQDDPQRATQDMARFLERQLLPGPGMPS